jgi:nitroreductase
MEKPATTDRPVHDLIRRRWSPRAFAAKLVHRDLLAALFEAARWAPSCFNEQPWSWVVSTSDDPEAHDRAGSVFSDGNAWARSAPVLALSLARTTFSRNDRPNPHAWHDLGAASMSLCLEAVNHGLVVHQMAGFDRGRAREIFRVPEIWEPVAMMAIGFPGDPESLPGELREREMAPRSRKKVDEMVFSGEFGSSIGFNQGTAPAARP